jgi:hypothetical protein
MNQKNLDYLKENLLYMGFSDRLYPDLQKNIEQGFPEFTLKQQTEYGKLQMESTLYFRRSDQSDMYFFNRHDAHLKNGTDATNNLQQTFYLNKGRGITLKESFNLLQGRAVNTDLTPREGEKYNAWVQLNFGEKDEHGNFKMKQFHQNYGYDVVAAMAKYPIKELEDSAQTARLKMSLDKGNLQSVTMTVQGKEEKYFISANPQFKTIDIHDSHMRRVQKEGLLNNKEQDRQQAVAPIKVNEENSQKQAGKQEPGAVEEEGGAKQAPRKRRNNKQSIS